MKNEQQSNKPIYTTVETQTKNPGKILGGIQAKDQVTYADISEDLTRKAAKAPKKEKGITQEGAQEVTEAEKKKADEAFQIAVDKLIESIESPAATPEKSGASIFSKIMSILLAPYRFIKGLLANSEKNIHASEETTLLLADSSGTSNKNTPLSTNTEPVTSSNLAPGINNKAPGNLKKKGAFKGKKGFNNLKEKTTPRNPV